MEGFPRVQRWLATADLPEDHQARDLSLSDPIVPALEYFLSLQCVPGFERRFKNLEREATGPASRITGERDWASKAAELGAIRLIGRELGLPLLGFDQPSPRAARASSDCDVVAEVEGKSTYFEVKRRSSEDLQTPPRLLRDELTKLDVPYSLSVEMHDRNYGCEDLNKILAGLSTFLDFMHEPENRDLWWGWETVPPAFPAGPFTLWFHEKDTDSGLSEHLECDTRAALRTWLLRKLQEARGKGADYLMTRVDPAGPWGDLVVEYFGAADQDGPRTYSVTDAELDGLRGLVLFSHYDRFCIVNNQLTSHGPHLSA